MSTRIALKRGSTFEIRCKFPRSIEGYQIKSQVKSSQTPFVAELQVIVDNAALGEYRLRFSDTSSWPAELLRSDIKYVTEVGDIFHTETFTIDCTKSITS